MGGIEGLPVTITRARYYTIFRIKSNSLGDFMRFKISKSVKALIECFAHIRQFDQDIAIILPLFLSKK